MCREVSGHGQAGVGGCELVSEATSARQYWAAIRSPAAHICTSAVQRVSECFSCCFSCCSFSPAFRLLCSCCSTDRSCYSVGEAPPWRPTPILTLLRLLSSRGSSRNTGSTGVAMNRLPSAGFRGCGGVEVWRKSNKQQQRVGQHAT